MIAGAAATMSCVASGGGEAAVTFHKASDDSSVDTVELTHSVIGNGVTQTTATLTLASVDTTVAGEYYCRASWNGGAPVRSNNAYLYVFDFGTAQATIWGLVDQSVQFTCKTHSSLMKSATEIRDDIENDAAVATIVWQYRKTGNSAWSDSGSDSSYVKLKSIFSGQLAFCKKAVEGLAVRIIF